MAKLNLDYYYGREAEQFTFYRLPKALITDDRFKGISNNAKLLYGLMLDRMSLSRRRGWLDEEDRVFIKYSKARIAEDLNVAKNTGSALVKELETIGLIDVFQENGKANIIYVKNFISEETGSKIAPVENDECDEEECYMDTYDEECLSSMLDDEKSVLEPDQNLHQSKICTGSKFAPVQKLHRSNNWSGTGAKFEGVPVQNLTPNNNIANNNLSNNHPIHLSTTPSGLQENDSMDQVEAYMEIIKENIDYDIMMSDKQWKDAEMYDELYQLICDVVCVPRSTIRIGGEDYPYNLVKSKFLKLNSSHLQYVISCMNNNTTKVANIKAYLITALYNAPNTMSHYYTSVVNHDFYGSAI